MTRVLHIVGSLNRGGAETWIIQVLRHMSGTGVQFDFVVHGDGPFHYQAEAKELGAQIFVCRGLGFPPLYGLSLMRILRRHGPYQAVHSHCHHFSGIPLLVAALAGVPVRVVQSHLDTRQLDLEAGFFRQIYTGVMKRLIWMCATVGTAVSSRAADALFPATWRQREKWRVMSLGIDPKPFLCPVDGEAVRRELGIPTNVSVIGHVGRFEAQKNHTFLLRVAAEYLKSAPQTVVLLLGDGPLRKRIEAEARDLGIAKQICFAGVRKDIPRVMSGVMDVFLFPSLYEGLGLVLLEAQAAGVPCLISDRVPKEACIDQSLIYSESLGTSAKIWADRLLKLTASGRRPGEARILKAVSIDESVRGIARLYPNSQGT